MKYQIELKYVAGKTVGWFVSFLSVPAANRENAFETNEISHAQALAKAAENNWFNIFGYSVTAEVVEKIN